MKLIFLIIPVGLLSWFIWYLVRDNRAFFRRATGEIKDIRTDVISRISGFRTEHFELQCSRGFRLSGYIKIPDSSNKAFPVMLLLGGVFTGKNVVELVENIPEVEPVIIVSIDYPYEGKKRLKWWQIILALPKIRRAAVNSVRGLLLMIDMLSKRDEVDENRIYLSGVSFGAFFGIAAAACDTRIRSVASLYGGGKLEKLVASNLPFRIPVINHIIGIIAKFIVYPFEPLHYVRDIAPRPLLVVGSSSDEKFPEACARALYDKASQPKDLLWFQSKHPNPTRNDLTLEMTYVVARWMKNRGLLKEKP